MGNSYSEPEGYADSEDLTYEQTIFPLRIKLNSNLPAGVLSRRHGITKGVELNIHFMKTTASILMESTTTGQQYVLPLTSTTPFSPLYVPAGGKQNMEAALNGYTFDSVSDIIHTAPCSSVPSAVCASEGYVLMADDQACDSTLESIDKDDVLIIDTTRLLRATSSNAPCDVLSCYNVSQSQHVELMSSCGFKFTTRPDKLSLLPKELFRHCHTSLPMPIVHNISRNTPPMQSPMVFTAIVKHFNLNTFVISQHNPLPSISQTTDLLEVHVNHPVEYDTLLLSPLDDNNLRHEACKHFSDFLSNTQTISITLLKDANSFQDSLLTYTPSAQHDTLFHMIPPQLPTTSTGENVMHAVYDYNMLLITHADVQCTVDVLTPLPPPPMLDLPQLSCDPVASSDYTDDNYCHMYESLDSVTANAYLQRKTSEGLFLK